MRVVLLNGEWTFGEAPPGWRPGTEPGPSEWLPAAVPGCVHTDLMAAGRIPDPFLRLNARDVAWVAEKDWLYVREFEVDETLLSADAVELVCEGLDTFATIALNEREIARTENAFIGHVFDVKDALRPGRNVLAVRFESSDRICAEREARSGKLPGGARVYARKPQYATGWDWGPVLPTCGVWRGVFLRGFDTARIESVHAPADLVGALGRVGLSVELRRTNGAPLTVNAALSRDGRNVASVEVRHVGDRAEAALEVPRPDLWWPAGCGDQGLYDLAVRVRDHERELDRRELRIGFRTCELERRPDDEGESFIFKVNGRRIFCKGANWIPADSFLPRVTAETYRRLLEAAVEGHMNMIRVWGGGVYEPDVFYDVCDELGLLVWQDFMYACSDYPDEDWFRRQAAAEARAVVARLRNHPCIALYCGNNENQWMHEMGDGPETSSGDTIYTDILPDACRELDPARPYWPGSPYGGPGANSEAHGDCHDWDVWHGSVEPKQYLEKRPRFVSEFGFQGFPTMDTLVAFAEPGDLSLKSEVMAHHQRCPGGTEKIEQAVRQFLGEPRDFDEAVLFSQMMQAEALRIGIEHWRRHKWHTAGALVWQLNDCWPAISWALVDSGLRPKPAYYAVRRAFAPVVLTAHAEGENVVITGINDTEQGVSGTLDIELFDLLGEAQLVRTAAVSVPADGVAVLCSVPADCVPGLDPSRHFLWATFYGGMHQLSAAHLFSDPKDLAASEPGVQLELEADPFDFELTLRVTATAFAKGVWLSVPGEEVRFSDNAFDLAPYMSREVRVTVGEGVAREKLREAITVRHCNPSAGRGM